MSGRRLIRSLRSRPGDTPGALEPSTDHTHPLSEIVGWDFEGERLIDYLIGYVHKEENYTASPNDKAIGVGTSAGTYTITLPTASVVKGRAFIIKDEDGNAATNNITVATEGSETIDGAATYVLTSNYESVGLYSYGTNWFTV